MIIPPDALSDDALAGVIEEFVTRDGTDLAELDAKAAAVRRALGDGLLVIVFDPEEQSCNLMPPEDAAAAEAAREARDPEVHDNPFND